jgi:hypothetical protein
MGFLGKEIINEMKVFRSHDAHKLHNVEVVDFLPKIKPGEVCQGVLESEILVSWESYFKCKDIPYIITRGYGETFTLWKKLEVPYTVVDTKEAL